MIEAEIREQLREKQREAGREAHRGKPKANGKVSPNPGKDLCRPRDAADEAAKTTGASSGYVSDADRIRKADPDLFRDVKAGKTTIPEAKRKQISLPTNQTTN